MKSFDNKAMAEYKERLRKANPELAALWGNESTGSPESETGAEDQAAAYAAEQSPPDPDEDGPMVDMG